MAKIKQEIKSISSLRMEGSLITAQDVLGIHIVEYFKYFFSNPQTTMHDQDLINACKPHLIHEEINIMLTRTPSNLEMKEVVFNIKKDGAPNLDGFKASFFHQFWEVIQLDVIASVVQFLNSSCILPNYNVNTLVLLPKVSHANYIDLFRPIALTNFKSKTISMVLVDRLASITYLIIYKEKNGFVKGRCIKDYIGVTFEEINLLHKKAF